MNSALLNCARHELGHVVPIHLCGYDFDGVTLDAEEGCTIWSPGVTPATFPDAYEQSPLRASLALVQIISIVRAGNYCELHGGQHGHASTGRDLADLEAWRHTVVQMGGQEYWVRAYTESIRGLQAWYKHAAVQRCIAAMAPVLLDNRSMSRYALLSLFEMGGVGAIPEPRWSPVIAPATSRPGVPAAAAVRRPASPTMDLARFARSPSGAIRPLSPAEWAWMKQHSMQDLLPYLKGDEGERLVALMEQEISAQEEARYAR